MTKISKAFDAAEARVPNRSRDTDKNDKERFYQGRFDYYMKETDDVQEARRRARSDVDKKFGSSDALDVALARIPDRGMVGDAAEYMTFYSKGDILYFRSSRGRTGSEPLNGKDPRQAPRELAKRLGVPRGEYEFITDSAFDAALARIPRHTQDGGEQLRLEYLRGKAKRGELTDSEVKELETLLHKKKNDIALDRVLAKIPDRRGSRRQFTLRGGLDAVLARGRARDDASDILQDYITKKLTREQAEKKLFDMGIRREKGEELLKEADKRRAEVGDAGGPEEEEGRWGEAYNTAGKKVRVWIPSKKTASEASGERGGRASDRLDAALRAIPDRRRAQDSTFTDVRAQLGALGLTLKKSEDDEYCVNKRGGREATAYYTDDLDDALSTGKVMAAKGAW